MDTLLPNRQLILNASQEVLGSNIGANLRTSLFELAGQQCFLEIRVLEDLSVLDYIANNAIKIILRSTSLKADIQIQEEFGVQLESDELGMFELSLKEELGFPHCLEASSRTLVRNGFKDMQIGSSLVQIGHELLYQYIHYKANEFHKRDKL